MGKIKQNLFYHITYQILALIIPLITTPYLSRILGKTGIGEFSYYYTIASYFVVFIKLGLDNYGNRSIAMSKDNKNKLSETFWNIYAMQICISILCICIYFFYCLFIANNVSSALIFSIFVISSMIDITWFISGMEEFKINALRNAIIKFLSTVAIFIFVKNENDVLIYVTIISISSFLSQLIVWPLVFKYTKFVRPKIKCIIKHIKPNLILFIPIIAGTLYRTTGKIMIGMLSSPAELGLFENSDKIIQLPTVFANAAGYVLMPRMSNMLSNNETQSKKELLSKTMILVLATTIPMSFGIMAISDIFVPWYYGDGFEKCSILFQILAPTCIFSAFGTVIRSLYLIPNKKDSIYVISTFLGVIINMIINVLLINSMGSIGASIGVLVAEFTVCLYQTISVWKDLDIKKYLSFSILFLMAGILMYVIIKNFTIMNNSLFITLIINILIGIFIYFTCIILFVYFGYRKRR